MRYFKLMYNYEYGAKYAGCKTGDLGGLDDYSTMKGVPLQKITSRPVFPLDKSEGNVLSDFLHNVYGWLLVSERFINLTKEHIENAVEYLPVDIVSDGIIINEKYSVINVINLLDALDLDNSVYSVIGEDDWKMLNIKKHALKGRMIQGQHVFKLKDDVFPVFVSEVVKNIVQKNKLTGFSFSEVKVID